MFVTCEPGERFLPVAVQALGGGRVIYASDFPHELEYEEYPEGIEELKARDDLTEAEREDVLGGAARQFYGLKRAAPVALR